MNFEVAWGWWGFGLSLEDWTCAEYSRSYERGDPIAASGFQNSDRFMLSSECMPFFFFRAHCFLTLEVTFNVIPTDSATLLCACPDNSIPKVYQTVDCSRLLWHFQIILSGKNFEQFRFILFLYTSDTMNADLFIVYEVFVCFLLHFQPYSTFYFLWAAKHILATLGWTATHRTSNNNVKKGYLKY